MPTERTLVIIKPDAVENEWTQDIIYRYIMSDLSVVHNNYHTMSRELARRLYKEHEDKDYFAGIYLAMSSGVSMIVILEGEDAISRVRTLNGATDPTKASPGTIRHDFRSAGGPFNTVHASDSHEAFKREVLILKYFGALPEPLIF